MVLISSITKYSFSLPQTAENISPEMVQAREQGSLMFETSVLTGSTDRWI